MSETRTAATLSEKLKERTKINHQNLEKKLIGRLKLTRSLNEYAQLLSYFYSFFGGLELCINKRLDFDAFPDYHLRRKTSAMVNDLNRMNSALPALATNQALPEIVNQQQAIGALYVIEGSTLGGQIICKMLNDQIGSIDPACLSFFSGYGDQTYQMWNAFKLAIDEITKPDDQEIVIESANNTFLQFGNWFDQNR